MKTRLQKYISFVLWGFFISSISLYGQMVSNLNPIQDNSIYSENNNSNGLGELFSGRTGINNGNNFRRALIKFDLTSIPTGATITNVTLTVNANFVSPGAGTETYNIYGLTKDWGEGTSFGGGFGAPAIAPDATWNDANFGTLSWTTPGGDFSVVSLANLNLTIVGSYTFLSTANFVNLTQSWLDNPSVNNGIILIGDETKSNTARQFGSKDIGVAPILSVSWNPPLSTEEFSINKFMIYPNPSNSEINLQLPTSVTNASVKVFNILGKEVYSSGKYEAPINISNWQNGVYLVQVSDLENTKTKRFIKL